MLLDDREFEAIQEVAAREGMTMSEWVRQLLRSARSEQPTGDRARKLAAVRDAARHRFPAPDIDQMLAEIERGYLG